jgi:hypothetical protein
MNAALLTDERKNVIDGYMSCLVYTITIIENPHFLCCFHAYSGRTDMIQTMFKMHRLTPLLIRVLIRLNYAAVLHKLPPDNSVCKRYDCCTRKTGSLTTLLLCWLPHSDTATFHDGDPPIPPSIQNAHIKTDVHLNPKPELF